MATALRFTDEQKRLAITVAAQLDYADHTGNTKCCEAAIAHARQLLRSLGVKTAEEEDEEECEE